LVDVNLVVAGRTHTLFDSVPRKRRDEAMEGAIRKGAAEALALSFAVGPVPRHP
jgi:hypothetical protein